MSQTNASKGFQSIANQSATEAEEAFNNYEKQEQTMKEICKACKVTYQDGASVDNFKSVLHVMLGNDSKKESSLDAVCIEYVSKACTVHDLHTIWQADDEKKRNKLIEAIAKRPGLNAILLTEPEKIVVERTEELQALLEKVDDESDEEEQKAA